MTPEKVIALVRDKVTELQTTGRFDNPEMVDILNEAMDTLIEDLWEWGFTFLESLRVTGDLSLSESAVDENWVEGDLSTLSSFLPIYRPSLNLYISDNGKWYRVKQVRGIFAKTIRFNDTYPTKTIKADVKGDIVTLHSSDYDEVAVEAVFSPTYTYGDTDDIGVANPEIRRLLFPLMCMEIKKRDLGIIMERDYERDYTKRMNALRRNMLGKRSPIERVPPYYRHHGYPSKGTIYNG